MKSFLFAMLTLVTVPAMAANYPYIPIQPAHTGDWYSPDRNGEGLDISVIPSDDEGEQPTIWIKLFGQYPDGTGSFWVVAQSEVRNAWSPRYNDYSFRLLSMTLGGEAQYAGYMILTINDTDTITMDYQVTVDGFEITVSGVVLYPLVRDTDGFVGFCNHHITFSPPYPPVQNLEYCPHIY